MSLSSILTDTFGFYTIGTFLSAILLGVTCSQAWYYFNTYSDPPIIKITVATLLALEMLHVAVSIHALYYFLITNYFNPLALLQNVWSINILFGIIGFIVLLVHLSYAMRIYHVSGKKKLIPFAIAVMSFGNFALDLALVVVLFRERLVSQLPGLPETLSKAMLGSSMAIDLIIAFTLCYYLNKSRSGIKQTDRLINRLMIYTINNGILTSILDFIVLSLVIARPKELLFFAVSQVLATVYSNSLLATLNSRKKIKKNQELNVDTSNALVTINFGQPNISGSSSSPGPEKHERQGI